MKNTQSLKRNNDFRRIYSRGKSFAGGYVVVYVLKNRSKRVIRAAYTNLEDKLPQGGFDLVIVSRSRGAQKKEQQIRKDMEYALRKLDLLT